MMIRRKTSNRPGSWEFTEFFTKRRRSCEEIWRGWGWLAFGEECCIIVDMTVSDKEMKNILAEQQEQTERYLGALKKDFDSKLDAVLEYVKDIPAIMSASSGRRGGGRRR